MEKFLACKFSKKVAKLASQNIPYTYFMFTSYLTGNRFMSNKGIGKLVFIVVS